ncbi:MAG TPA: hypothetical protein VFZ27_17900 [Terriglobia bacterium]|nr:hypothetical protein [Terriglobia bacterium]
MKVYFNLAVASERRERYALAWAVPTLVISLLVLLWLAGSTVRYMGRARQAEKSLADVQTQEAALRSKENTLRSQIDRPEYRSLIQKTEFVNQLISQRQFSLTDLTSKVSRLLPPSARLNGLALASASADDPEVQFVVMGKDERAIETFLSNLEGSKDFSDVLIKSQGARGGSGGGPQEMALVCTARYIGLASPSNN